MINDEYEQAVEIVAKRLFRIKYPAYVWEAIKKEEEQEFTEHARSLLRLTWPSGQPVIGVLASNQTPPLPQHKGLRCWQDAANEAYEKAGFRRVVEKR